MIRVTLKDKTEYSYINHVDFAPDCFIMTFADGQTIRIAIDRIKKIDIEHCISDPESQF